ncbi:aurora/IPL1-related protein kinase 2-like isoform X3 [Biomphalaria glabrata]|uniref:Aurora/IPL1-related protein kinase 2-like isoform X3 n=1 Tax=Biomphalaria glabrata TaxID=6526 RepID=A0A9W3BP65_BIOGL|nr:aurora/IPL1-related protein kinase 2-like isoform X3 [Biomphalaria glabrata]
MHCCSKKGKYKDISHRTSVLVPVTGINQEYYDFVESSSQIANESARSGMRKVQNRLMRSPYSEIHIPPDCTFNMVEENYFAKQSGFTVGSWKKYEAAEFQTVKLNIFKGSTSKNYYIFLEFAPFRTLDHLTQAMRGLGSDCARLYAMEVTCALKFLHERNIMHRDVKPENIYILLSGHVALADLGSSLRMDGDTIVSAACGTYVTRPPEVWSGHPYSKSVDIWQFGMTLFNIISNSWPIVHPNREKHISLVNNGKILFSDHFKDDASTNLIGKMLQINPNRRLTSSQILKHEYFEPLKEPYSPPFTPLQLFNLFDLGEEEVVIKVLVNSLESTL